MEEVTIVAVRKNFEGRPIMYKLSDGREVSVVEAVNICNMGGLAGLYLTAQRWDGEWYIRSRPDGTRSNNLLNLPEF